MKTPLKQLELILAPFGIKTVTTGSYYASHYLKTRYGSLDETIIRSAFCEELKKIVDSKAIILGIPNDNGASLERGSKFGPLGIRQGLSLNKEDLIDIGDVKDHPLLIEDTLYQNWVIEAVRKSRWGHLKESANELQLPVSSLSILDRALECIYALNPKAKVLLLGGDHSKSLIPINVLTRGSRNTSHDLGILQFDAHTDLLETRDGIPHSHATWAWHANEKLKRGGRLIQVEIRVSEKTKEYWEKNLEVKQYWATEVNANEKSTIESIISHFNDIGIKRLYLSNDIDAISPEYAWATGTPEPHGLHPDFIFGLIEALGKHFTIVGSDIMEVAPPLHRECHDEPHKTLELASQIAMKQLESMLHT